MKEILIPLDRFVLRTQDFLAVQEALVETAGACGRYGELFQDALCQQLNVPYAVAFASEAMAFEAAFFACRLSCQDRIIASPNNSCTPLAAAWKNRPAVLLSDIDPSCGLMDIRLTAELVNQPRSRGRSIVVASHYMGYPCDTARLQRRLKNPDTLLIEDATDALGSLQPNGQPIGSCSHSDMAVLSLRFPHIVNTGIGGVVTTPHEEIYRRLLCYQNAGIDVYNSSYAIEEPSTGCPLSSFAAALGLSQVKNMEDIRQQVASHASYLSKHLLNVPFLTTLPGTFLDFALPRHFVVLIDCEGLRSGKEELRHALAMKGIGSDGGYYPLYHHPFYKKRFGDKSQHFPRCESFHKLVLHLPLYHDMSQQQLDHMIACLQSAIG